MLAKVRVFHVCCHVFCVAVLLGGGLYGGGLLGLTSHGDANLRETAIVLAVRQARPSVVNIRGRKTVAAETDTISTQTNRQVNGMGTGIVVDRRGYILTNYHVVQGVSQIQVATADKQTLTGRLIAHDRATDLAIIKIDAGKPLPVINVGDSSDLMPGEPVVAVGNAFGYEHTVTRGIISALHRSVQVSDDQKYDDLIQTDASINPGNSGGPLLNVDGKMIGINVAVRVGAQGIGFAIPVNEALEVAGRLLTTERIGKISHGVTGRTVHRNGQSHLEVKSVDDESPADKSGLLPGDIITAVDSTRVERTIEFERALIGRKRGEEVEVTVRRRAENLTLSLVLDDAVVTENGIVDLTWERLGMRLSPVSQRVFRQYNSRYRGGLKVVSVRSEGPASRQGIRRGDVLVGMHKWETISLDNVSYILSSEEFLATQPAKFYILRGGETLFGHIRATH